MANQNLLTNSSAVSYIEQEYYAPVAVSITTPTIPVKTTYCFIGQVSSWANNAAPPIPTQDQLSLKKVYANMIAAKLVNSSEISPVIQRIDWTANTVYAYYNDTNNHLFDINDAGQLINNFYVRNRFDQVFKCLWNVNGSPSINEPYFQPGSYGTNNIYQGPDGYKWKYMYTIDIGSKVKFMDANWIPVPITPASKNPLTTTAGFGSIDVVNVVSGGSGYSNGTFLVSIVQNPALAGSGTGFLGTATIVGNTITDIVVTSPGSNYGLANATVTPSTGNNAVLISPVSPIGGHGFDPLAELGCFNVMYSVEFNGSEAVNGVTMVPTDITYYQVGLVVNPTAADTAPNPANSTIYNTTTQLIVSPGFGTFSSNDQIYQGSTVPPTFSGTVVDFNTSTNVLSVINIQGVPVINAPVYNYSGVSRSLVSVSKPDFNLYTGYITYIDNRTGIQRSSDGIEQFKFVVSAKDSD